MLFKIILFVIFKTHLNFHNFFSFWFLSWISSVILGFLITSYLGAAPKGVKIGLSYLQWFLKNSHMLQDITKYILFTSSTKWMIMIIVAEHRYVICSYQLQAGEDLLRCKISVWSSPFSALLKLLYLSPIHTTG